jgi:peptide/nickel transport system substrate-binding protein
MALAQAIDKDGLYQAVSPGATPPEDEPCSPTPPGLYFRVTEGLTCIEYDPAAAAAALDAAGWTDTNGDGTRDKDGVELSLLHCHTGAPFRVTAGDFIAAAFREIGVELRNTSAPETVFAGWNEVPADAECNLAHGNFDTADFAWVNTFDLLGNYYGYHSSRIPTEDNGGEGNNYVRLANEEMDAVLDQLFGLTDPEDQVEVAGEVQRLHTELQPEVVMYYRSSARVVNVNLENFAKNPGTSSDMWNVEDWYLAGG